MTPGGAFIIRQLGDTVDIRFVEFAPMEKETPGGDNLAGSVRARSSLPWAPASPSQIGSWRTALDSEVYKDTSAFEEVYPTDPPVPEYPAHDSFGVLWVASSTGHRIGPGFS